MKNEYETAPLEETFPLMPPLFGISFAVDCSSPPPLLLLLKFGFCLGVQASCIVLLYYHASQFI